MSHTFTSKLQGSADGPTGIEVPAKIIDAIDAGKKPAVSVDVNGYTYRSTVAVMGGKFMIPFSSAHRAASGIKAGDAIKVTLALDTAPREAEVPDDLAQALAKAKARAKFDALAPSRKKEAVRQVTEAKAAETRARRIEKIVAELG
jgi:hypothetical protein